MFYDSVSQFFLLTLTDRKNTCRPLNNNKINNVIKKFIKLVIIDIKNTFC